MLSGMPSRTSSADPCPRPLPLTLPAAGLTARVRPQPRPCRTRSVVSRSSPSRCCPATVTMRRSSSAPARAELGEHLGSTCSTLLELDRATGKAGEVTRSRCRSATPRTPTSCVALLVGVGDAGSRRPAPGRRRAGPGGPRPALGRHVGGRGRARGGARRRSSSGRCSGRSRFHWRAEPPEHRPVGRVVLAALPDDLGPALARAVALGGAGWRSRMLATVPSNLKNPPWLAGQAERLAAEAGLEVTVWDEAWLAEQRLRRHRRRRPGVGHPAAPDPARLHAAQRRAGVRRPSCWSARASPSTPAACRSSRPRRWSNMKRDMTGGAVVLATMAALADVGCPVRVVGLVAAAENAVSGNALRPGDVVRHYGGRTVRGHQHRRRGPAGARRRAGVRRRGARARRGRRRRDAHRRDEGRARAAGRAAFRQPTTGWPSGCSPRRRRGRRAAVADAAGRRLRGEARLARSPTPTTRRAVPARSPPRCSSSTSSATCRGRTSTSPRSATPRTTGTSGPPGRPGSAPARSWTGWAPTTRWPESSVKHALTVRWSLADAPAGIEEALAAYVAGHLHARFTGMAGLRVQDLADAPGGVVRGLLRLRLRPGARGVPGDLHRGRRRLAGLAAGRQRAGPHRGVRGRRGRRGLATASSPRRAY